MMRLGVVYFDKTGDVVAKGERDITHALEELPCKVEMRFEVEKSGEVVRALLSWFNDQGSYNTEWHQVLPREMVYQFVEKNGITSILDILTLSRCCVEQGETISATYHIGRDSRTTTTDIKGRQN